MISEYEKIANRLWKLLQQRPAMPYFGIQYLLCEVGGRRISHHQLSSAMERLLATGSLVEAKEGVFVESADAAQHLIGEVQEVSRLWVKRPSSEHDAAVSIIANRICEQLSRVGLAEVVEQLASWGGPGKQLPTHRSRYVDLHSPRMPATIWVSWHEEAICPTQSSFWAFLEQCSNRGRTPLLVARAVTKLAFPVLKAVGARAVQYYCVPTPLEGGQLLELQEAAPRFGLPRVYSASEWGHMPFVDVLRTQIQMMAMAQAPDDNYRQVLQIAESRGFGDHQVSPTMLRRWASDIERQHGVRLPLAWKESLST